MPKETRLRLPLRLNERDTKEHLVRQRVQLGSVDGCCFHRNIYITKVIELFS